MKIGIDSRLLEGMRGGPARYVTNMLKWWPKLSNEHEYTLYFKDCIPSDDFLRQSCFTLKQVRSRINHFLMWENVAMPTRIRRDKLDLYFSPWYTLPFYFSCPRKVVAAWDISYTTNPEMYDFKSRKYREFFSKRACQKANGVVTCSYFDGEQIEKYYGVEKNKICVVQLAPEDKFKPLNDENELVRIKNKYQLPDKYLLSLGSIYNRRHLDVVIEAFKRIHNDYPDIGLVVIGKNYTVPKVNLRAMLKPLLQSGKSVYIERLDEDDLVAMYNGALWYICMSSCDGETILLKEAMKSGTPVITSPLLQEAVGDNAIIIESPNDLLQVEMGLRLAFSSDSLRTKLSISGLEWVKRFNWKKISEKNLSFFESLS